MLTADEEAHKAKLLDEISKLEAGARERWNLEARSKIYRFSNISNPSDLDEITRFQQIFGRHIPVLLESEHAAIVLHQKMLDGIFGNPVETIRHSTFDADLKRLRKAVQVLASQPIAYWQHLTFLRMKADPEDHIASGASEIFDFLLQVQEYSDDGSLSEILHRYEAWAREAVSQIPDRKNINWEAVHAVAMLRGYWEAWTETPAPRRALNPASPFADYLRNAFEFFSITGDHIAAFKRWVTLENAEPEKWK
jgi:hypothetical protein